MESERNAMQVRLENLEHFLLHSSASGLLPTTGIPIQTQTAATTAVLESTQGRSVAKTKSSSNRRHTVMFERGELILHMSEDTGSSESVCVLADPDAKALSDLHEKKKRVMVDLKSSAQHLDEVMKSRRTTSQSKEPQAL